MYSKYSYNKEKKSPHKTWQFSFQQEVKKKKIKSNGFITGSCEVTHSKPSFFNSIANLELSANKTKIAPQLI